MATDYVPVGKTPLVQLQRVVASTGAAVFAKCEHLNPTGSSKDRVAERLLRSHHLGPDVTLVVPTTGNLGVSIGARTRHAGCRLITVVPENTSADQIAALKAVGADIWRAPNVAGDAGFVGVARRLAEQIPGAILLDDYNSTNGANAHADGTAAEIVSAIEHFDVLICTVETGGTIYGTARLLREGNPSLRVIAVDAAHSAIASGQPVAGGASSLLEGVGAPFRPALINEARIDQFITVRDKDAFAMARRLIAEEGLFVGPSSGAAVHAAVTTAAQLPPSQKILVVLPDSARNYTSTLLNDEWIAKNVSRTLRAADNFGNATVADAATSLRTDALAPQATAADALAAMDAASVNYLPVIHQGEIVGSVSRAVLESLVNDGNKAIQTVDRLMEKTSRDAAHPVTIASSAPLRDAADLLAFRAALFVMDGAQCVGVITKDNVFQWQRSRA